MAMQISRDEFEESGFIIFPSLLTNEVCEEYKSLVDQYEKQDYSIPVENDNFKEILYNQIIHSIAGTLIGERCYVFHHMHAACHKAGTPSLGWHHDYERYKVSERSFKMLHIFFYLNGLNESIGDLLVIPGSHNWVSSRYEYSDLSFDHFEGVHVISKLPPGSVVVIHSALIHARRARSGGEGYPRYFIDMSFCEYGGKWFPYLEQGNWKSVLSDLLGYDNRVHGGNYRFMFDANQFHMNAKARIVHTLRLRPVINIVRRAIGNNPMKNLR